jgi:multisubunit Na+/H+ antiporter MnhC subunit
MTAQYILCLFLFLAGIYGIVTKRHLLKMAFAVTMMIEAVGIFIVLLGSSDGHVGTLWQTLGLMVVFGGMGIAVVMVVTAVRLYQKCGTFDMDEIWKLKG